MQHPRSLITTPFRTIAQKPPLHSDCHTLACSPRCRTPACTHKTRLTIWLSRPCLPSHFKTITHTFVPLSHYTMPSLPPVVNPRPVSRKRYHHKHTHANLRPQLFHYAITRFGLLYHRLRPLNRRESITAGPRRIWNDTSQQQTHAAERTTAVTKDAGAIIAAGRTPGPDASLHPDAMDPLV